VRPNNRLRLAGSAVIDATCKRGTPARVDESSLSEALGSTIGLLRLPREETQKNDLCEMGLGSAVKVHVARAREAATDARPLQLQAKKELSNPAWSRLGASARRLTSVSKLSSAFSIDVSNFNWELCSLLGVRL
jgi:hypothetical protein